MSLTVSQRTSLRAACCNDDLANELIACVNKIIDLDTDQSPDGLLVTNDQTSAAICTKIAGAIQALDGSNPTSVATGLTTIKAVSVLYEKGTTPGDDPSMLTYTVSGGTLSVFAWKNTGGTDPTLVASTDTGNFSWMVIGV